MAGLSTANNGFSIKDCALAVIALGLRAQTLREFRDRVAGVPEACIYHHFWGRLLRPAFDEPEFNNDFASWARHGLHDHSLAERLAVIDPTDFADLEALRSELVEVLDERLEETDFVASARPGEEFHFSRSHIVVFDTRRRLSEPRELASVVPHLSAGSIFYHVIDARRRPPVRIDDFRAWLADFGETYAELSERLATLDPYFVSLTQLRRQLADICTAYFEEHGR